MTTANSELRTFEELTEREVNDMIAVKIMGWEIALDPLLNSPGSYRGPNIIRLRIRGEHHIGGGVFNPYSSLDDCFLAEEKLAASGEPRDYISNYATYNYAKHLQDMIQPESIDYEGLSNCGVYQVIHATPQQKCHAMLLARNLISQ